MKGFSETFRLAENTLRPLIEKLGFEFDKIEIGDVKGSQWLYGSATYVKEKSWIQRNSNKRFIRIGVAPLRLEIDLDFGKGKEKFSIYELHKLNGKGEFPGLQHSLYKTENDESILAKEFSSLIQVLIECGSRFFEDDDTLFSDLKAQRQRYFKEEEDHRAFKEAEVAFKNKNWNKVIELLTDRENVLSKLNSSRLRYARKKIT